MICEKCGEWIEDGSKICSKCGAPVGTENAGNAATAAEAADNTESRVQTAEMNNETGSTMPGNQAPLTKDQFYKHPNIASVKAQVKGAGIACYIIGGLNLVLAIVSGGLLGSILDVLLIIGMGLGIHLGRSRVCAIILTVYGAINMIIMSIQMESLSGWLILLIGIYAVIYTFKYQSAWAEYQKTGVVRDFTPANKKAKK